MVRLLAKIKAIKIGKDHGKRELHKRLLSPFERNVQLIWERE